MHKIGHVNVSIWNRECGTVTHMIEHRKYFQGKLVRIYEDDNGKLSFDLEDIKNALNLSDDELNELMQDIVAADPNAISEIITEQEEIN